MRVLLDHCVDRRLARLLEGHTVSTVADMKWDELKNGRLLETAAEQRFNVFLTTDQNLRFQQNLAALPLAVVELALRDTRLRALLPLQSAILDAIAATEACLFVSVHADGLVERLLARPAR